MSRVYGIEVTFGRSRQPKDYETARADVTLNAEVDDGEDFKKVLTDLLATAAGTVYGAVGLSALALKQVPVDAPAPEAPAKAKRKRRTKAEILADKVDANFPRANGGFEIPGDLVYEDHDEGPEAGEALDPVLRA